jgi:hypothetical protein
MKGMDERRVAVVDCVDVDFVVWRVEKEAWDLREVHERVAEDIVCGYTKSWKVE